MLYERLRKKVDLLLTHARQQCSKLRSWRLYVNPIWVLICQVPFSLVLFMVFNALQIAKRAFVKVLLAFAAQYQVTLTVKPDSAKNESHLEAQLTQGEIEMVMKL